VFTPIAEMPTGAVGLAARGRITQHDRRTVLEPIIASILESGDKVKLLYFAGDDFDGYDEDSPWDEGVFGTRHFTDFERIAFVTDEAPYHHAVRALEGFMPADLRVFSADEIEAAKEWLAAA
jgi:hypothetical protein